MTFREQYERETGKCHFDYPNITRTSSTWDYVQWLENKLAQKPEVSEEVQQTENIQPDPDEIEPYCDDCGETKNLKYIDQYANGEYYECGCCGNKFFK